METIKIVEVGPRDGLQNETVIIPTEIKVLFIMPLSAEREKRRGNAGDVWSTDRGCCCRYIT